MNTVSDNSLISARGTDTIEGAIMKFWGFEATLLEVTYIENVHENIFR